MSVIEKTLDKYAKEVMHVKPDYINRMMVYRFINSELIKKSRKRNPILANSPSK